MVYYNIKKQIILLLSFHWKNILHIYVQRSCIMRFLGIEIEVKNCPELDRSFIPLKKFNDAFLEDARVPVSVAVEREGGEFATAHTYIHGTEEYREADQLYLNKLIKSLLWMKGGFRVFFSGPDAAFDYLKKAYSKDGVQAFDYTYFSETMGHPFEILHVESVPEECSHPRKIGGHMEGCRIGFDAGGSDRKVSAVLNGEPVYSEEVVWFPKLQSDPAYHYDGIVSALKSAAEHLPRVDAVGVSSAGVFINDRTMSASLFEKVPKEQYGKVRDIYIRAIRDTFGDIPYSVINDGDVTALAGALSLNDTNVLGIAMGTSEAGGYVNEDGCITGWLNELAFIPVDADPDGFVDAWSGDRGCGSQYFSQDAVINLAPRAGILLDAALSPAEKLKVVQRLMEDGDEKAAAIYRSIGVYLAHSLAMYHDAYGFRHVLLLGRVMSGKGGDILLTECRRVLQDEYPGLSIHIALPDEKFRRVGQSAVAASLPEIRS